MSLNIPKIEDVISDKPDNLSKKGLKDYYDTKKERLIGEVYLYGVRIAALSVGVLFIVRMIHFIFPMSWFWLCSTQIETIDRFLFSGAVGAIVGNYYGEIFKKTD